MIVEDKAVVVNFRVLDYCCFIKDELETEMKYYEKDLTISEKILPKDLLVLGSILNGITVIYYRRGDYGHSKEYRKRSLNINEKTFLSDHNFYCNRFT